MFNILRVSFIALSQSSTINLQATSSAKRIRSAVTSPVACSILPSLPLPMLSTATQGIDKNDSFLLFVFVCLFVVVGFAVQVHADAILLLLREHNYLASANQRLKTT